MAGIAHAQPGFGADQRDLVRIHAAELRDIQRELRLLLAIARCAGLQPAIGRQFIDAGDHAQVLRPQPGIERHGACQHLGIVGLGRVQAPAFELDGTAAHAVAVQAAIGAIARRARGQRHARGIDHRHAVDHQSRRIGDDHIGALACDFQRAAKP